MFLQRLALSVSRSQCSRTMVWDARKNLAFYSLTTTHIHNFSFHTSLSLSLCHSLSLLSPFCVCRPRYLHGVLVD